MVAMSSDGTTMAVGADGDRSAATGINGNQNDLSLGVAGAAFIFSGVATGVNGNQSDTTTAYAGAAYAFRRNNGTWSQKAYIKASNTKVLQGPRLNAELGYSIALAGDGASLVVSAPGERSNATGVDGNQADTSATGAGPAYFD